MPYLLVGRPGTFGSSGEHAKRRTKREIDLVSAALDAIKVRHGYTRLHLVGYAEGGHTAAALLARRTDLGCVVLASSLLSVRSWLAERGRSEDVIKDPLDPITLADRVVKRPDLRIFVVTDPDDIVISARSQMAYVRRLSMAGLPVRQIFAAAPDPSAHALWREARQIAAACASGMPDEKIVATYQNKVPEVAPDADDPPLHNADTLNRGITIGEKECKNLATTLWVRVDGRGFCVRYWMSTAGGAKNEALLYIHGDVGSRKQGKTLLNDYGTRITAGGLQRDAHRWSRVYGGPYVAIGRVGALGSSGDHLRERRTLLEVRVVMAALDVLKERHGFNRFHVVGQSGGGHTVASLLQKRTDLGCAVMTSGSMAVKSLHRDRGRSMTAKVAASYDPIEFVNALQDRPGQRMIVMSDPDDRIVSFRSQQEFVDRVKAKGLPILHLTAAADDERSHGLSSPGRRLAIDCAKGVDDGTLTTRYQNKKPMAQRQ
jgi:dienelactone hydrolase